MSPEQSRWSGLSDDAITTLDELLARQKNDILVAAARNARGQVDAVDILRAFNTSFASTPDAASLNTDSRIAALERRMSSLLITGLTAIFVVVLASGLFLLLRYALPLLNVPNVMLAYFALALGVVLLTTSGIWMLFILNHRARVRFREHRLHFSVPISARRMPHAPNDFTGSEESLEDEALATEESSIERYTFLSQWIAVERQIYQLAELALGPSDGRRSISAVVQSLVHDHVISGDAEFRIKRVLLSRNEAVHREQVRMDWPRLQYDLKQIDIELTAAARGLRARRGHSTGS